MRGNEIRPRLPDASVTTSGSPPSAASWSSSTAGSVSSSAVVSFVKGFAIAPRTPPSPAAVDIVTFRCMTPSSPISPASTGVFVAPGDDLLERRPVALEEGRALTLSVVREHDDVVRARRILGRAHDPVEGLVEVPEHGERIRALDARVVGDLVVARERRVHHGAPGVDVADDGGHGQVALDDDHERAQQRVDEAAMPAGPDVHLALLRGVPELLRDVRDHEHEGPDERERVREVREVAGAGALGVPLFLAEGRDGQRRVRRVPRVHVRAARAVGVQEPLAGTQPRLDREDVLRR